MEAGPPPVIGGDPAGCLLPGGGGGRLRRGAAFEGRRLPRRLDRLRERTRTLPLVVPAAHSSVCTWGVNQFYRPVFAGNCVVLYARSGCARREPSSDPPPRSPREVHAH